jgi:dephospho-CoA kinase
MILGLSGTISAGKDMLADHLQEKFGLMHISTADMVREIAMAQSGSIERPVLYDTAYNLRKTYGSAVLVERAIDRYHNSIRNYAGVIISDLRSAGEAKKIQELGGKLVFVDAPIELRYQRMVGRLRDGEAKQSFEDFKKNEDKELTSGMSDTDFNLTKIGEMADIRLQNSATPEEFYSTAEKALQLV